MSLRLVAPDELPSWAEDLTSWTGATPSAVKAAGGKYGTLIVSTEARGSWSLAHDPRGVLWVMTLFYDPGDEITYDNRRWHIVRQS